MSHVTQMPEQLGLLVCYYCASYVLNNYHKCGRCQYCICFECYRRVANCPRCNLKFEYHRDIGFHHILEDIKLDQIARDGWSFPVPSPNQIMSTGHPSESMSEIEMGHIPSFTDHNDSVFENYQYNPTTNLTDDAKSELKNDYSVATESQEVIGLKKKIATEMCPLRDYESCTWKGCTKKDIIRHCDRNHFHNIHHTNKKMLRIREFEAKNCNTTDMCVLFVAFNELFRFYSQTNLNDKVVKWQCYYAGNKKFLKRFHYEISFQKVYTSTDEVAIRAPCQLWKDDVPDFENFIMLSYETLRQYCHEGDLYCCVKILDKNYYKKPSESSFSNVK